MKNVQEYELDLLQIFVKLWYEKWKIILISFLFTTLGFLYSLSIPDSFKIDTFIDEGRQSVFIEYKSLNDVLKENKILSHTASINRQENSQNYIVDTHFIFEMFISEFRDYDEIIDVLSRNTRLMNLLENKSKIEKRKALVEYAKLFKIHKSKEAWKASLIWNDPKEGINLFNDAIILTLENVKKRVLIDLNNLAKSIDMSNKRKLDDLNLKLSLMSKINKLMISKRIRYLKEQSIIAKELKIEENKLDFNALIQSPTVSYILPDQDASSMNYVIPDQQKPNFDDYPYYLRGFKAIDKEIALINKRSKEEKNLMAEGYLDIMKKIFSIKLDTRSSQLLNSLNNLNKNTPSNWINYNFEFATVQRLNKTLLYIFLSAVLGIMFGSIFVLGRDAFLKRLNKKI